MSCELCQSSNKAEFTAEMMLHFTGLQNIDNPGVPTFPKVLICLDCGFSRFTATAIELSLLKKGAWTRQPAIGQKRVGQRCSRLEDCAEIAGSGPEGLAPVMEPSR
jgi:hypothetical protein